MGSAAGNSVLALPAEHPGGSRRSQGRYRGWPWAERRTRNGSVRPWSASLPASTRPGGDLTASSTRSTMCRSSSSCCGSTTGQMCTDPGSEKALQEVAVRARTIRRQGASPYPLGYPRNDAAPCQGGTRVTEIDESTLRAACGSKIRAEQSLRHSQTDLVGSATGGTP